MMETVPPNGGWRLMQKYAGGEILLSDGTLPDTVKKVKDFRTANNIPVGNPEAEIRAYCGGTHIQPAQQRSLRERVTNWKVNRQFQQHQLIDESIAEKRAQICKSCPMNQQSWVDGCSECYSHTLRDLFAMRQGRSAKIPIGACKILGWDNATAVHLTEASLKNRVQHLEQLPDHCWAKKL